LDVSWGRLNYIIEIHFHQKTAIMKKKYWDIFILLLSLYVIVELAIEIIYPFSQKTIDLINTLDLFICAIFLGDFFYFLYAAKGKEARVEYLKHHWIDFVASIPFMSFLRAFRLVRVVRIVRLLRGVKGIIHILRLLGTNRIQNIMISYFLILVLVLFYCSLAFYSFELGVNPNVHCYFDAFWWAFVSLTTIGYGDIFPVTVEGRVAAMVLALAGIGLFSLITAQLATYFIKVQKQEQCDKKNDNGKHVES